MIDSHRLVVCSPAGRQRPMSCLATRLLSDPDVDRWDIWENTQDANDLAYIRSLESHPKVRVVRLPVPFPNAAVGWRIFNFYPHATDEDSVYIRLDDDIIWYERGAIHKVAEKRLRDPHPFIVYGNVVNSSITSFRQQSLGRIPREWGVLNNDCMDPVGWADGAFAVRIHEKFLNDANPSLWYLDDFVLSDYRRYSINAISWMGRDAQEWSGKVNPDEEQWMAVVAPQERGRANAVRGDAIFVHLSFYTQHAAVENAGILDRYRHLIGTGGIWQ